MNNVTLLIVKNEGAETNFSHYFSTGLEFAASDFEFTLVNGEFQIKELNGAQIFPVTWNQVTLRDDSSGTTGTPYTASSAIDLYNKLDDLGYTPLLSSGGAITGLIEGGMNVTITGSGTDSDPYVINASTTGSTTYINAGSNVNVTGDGSVGDPYVISATDTVGIESITAGANIAVDATDPANPVVSAPNAVQDLQSVIENGGVWENEYAQLELGENGAIYTNKVSGAQSFLTDGQVSVFGGSFFHGVFDFGFTYADYSDPENTYQTNIEYEQPTGSEGKIIIPDVGDTTDTFALVSQLGTGGPATTDALPEGSSNLYFTAARVRDAVLSGISFVTGGAISSADTVLQAFGKLQNQISDVKSTAPRVLYKSSAYGANIATTAQTTVHTFNFAPGSTAAGTKINLIEEFGKSAGAANSVTINAYLNTISLGTQLAQCVYNSATRQIYFERTFNIHAAAIEMVDRGNNIVTDRNVGTTNRSTIAYNPAVSNDIIITVTVATNTSDGVYPASHIVTQY